MSWRCEIACEWYKIFGLGINPSFSSSWSSSSSSSSPVPHYYFALVQPYFEMYGRSLGRHLLLNNQSPKPAHQSLGQFLIPDQIFRNFIHKKILVKFFTGKTSFQETFSYHVSLHSPKSCYDPLNASRTVISLAKSQLISELSSKSLKKKQKKTERI